MIFFGQRNRISKEKKRSDELLLNILPEETADELKELWEEHFLCKSSVSSTAAPIESIQATVLAEPTTLTKTSNSSDEDDVLDDATVQELLKGLD